MRLSCSRAYGMKGSYDEPTQLVVTSLTIHGQRPDTLILVRSTRFTDRAHALNFPVWQRDGTPPAHADEHADGLLMAIWEGLV
jgi:hypothetical protein